MEAAQARSIVQQVPSERRATDGELVASAPAGNRSAFAELVERHQTFVFCVAYARLGGMADSEEIAQEAFVRAWQRLPTLRDPERFREWLGGIAHFICREQRRHQRHRLSQQDPSALEAELVANDPTPVERAISKEEEQLLWRALAGMPEGARAALLLYYSEQRSIDDVAAALGLTVRSASNRIENARKRIRARLSDVEPALSRVRPRKGLAAAVLAAIALPAVGTARAGTSASAAGRRMGRGLVIAGATGLGLAVIAGGVLIFMKATGARPGLAAAEGDAPSVPRFRVGAATAAAPARRLPAIAGAAPATTPAAAPPAPSFFSFDFEEGSLPKSFDFAWGEVVPAPPGNGSRFCLVGTLEQSTGRARITVTAPADRPFQYSDRLVIEFDYWFGPDANKKLRVEMWNTDKDFKYIKYLGEAVRGAWTHATIRVADLTDRFPSEKRPLPPLEPGDRLKSVFIFGGQMPSHPLYIDNFTLREYPEGQVPATDWKRPAR